MKNITAKLNFELEKEPEMGKPFTIYANIEWMSSESKNGKFYLLSTAGMGGTQLLFKANGKTYKVDMKEVFKELIQQVI